MSDRTRTVKEWWCVMSLATQPYPVHCLISGELHEHLIAQITREKNIDRDAAERIVAGTLVYLKVCAANPDQALRPSKAVDVGWHTFILNTRAYAEFCQRVAGRFIHHQPESFTPPTDPAAALAPTIMAIQAAGLEVDPTVWATGSGDCSQCHAGCTDCK